MRGSYVLGFGITLLWILSPVGGQSALRLLNTTPNVVSFNATIRYEPIEGTIASTMLGAQSAEQFWPIWASTYMTSLRTSTSLKNATRDLLGNIRIPNLDALDTSYKNQENFTIVNRNQPVPYVSLLGVPMADVPAGGNSSFQISSQYFDVTCSNIVSLDNASIASSATIETVNANSNTFGLASDLNSTANVTVGQVVSFNFTSGVWDDENTTWSSATCSLVARVVDCLVACVDGACQVDAMRNSTTAASQAFTIDPVFILSMFLFLPLASFQQFSRPSGGGMQHGTPTGSSMTEWYISDPSTDYAATPIGAPFSFVSMDQVPLDTFTTNLGVVLNTLWQSTYCNELLAGGFPSGLVYNDTASDQTINLGTATASVTTIDGTQFICNRTFAGILIIISILLLIEAFVSLVLMIINIAPDTLGYVSSYTRDNVHFPSKEASHLDGLERSSAMRDVYTILGDVRAGDEVGHIAFTSNPDAQPLRKGRLYD
jgi:hypothetical protein